jgi:hypothetical protein
VGWVPEQVVFLIRATRECCLQFHLNKSDPNKMTNQTLNIERMENNYTTNTVIFAPFCEVEMFQVKEFIGNVRENMKRTALS